MECRCQMLANTFDADLKSLPALCHDDGTGCSVPGPFPEICHREGEGVAPNTLAIFLVITVLDVIYIIQSMNLNLLIITA